jgi:uncharacterized coiled-coil protein SlyX
MHMLMQLNKQLSEREQQVVQNKEALQEMVQKMEEQLKQVKQMHPEADSPSKKKTCIIF